MTFDALLLTPFAFSVCIQMATAALAEKTPEAAAPVAAAAAQPEVITVVRGSKATTLRPSPPTPVPVQLPTANGGGTDIGLTATTARVCVM